MVIKEAEPLLDNSRGGCDWGGSLWILDEDERSLLRLNPKFVVLSKLEDENIERSVQYFEGGIMQKIYISLF